MMSMSVLQSCTISLSHRQERQFLYVCVTCREKVACVGQFDDGTPGWLCINGHLAFTPITIDDPERRVHVIPACGLPFDLSEAR